MYNEKEKLQMMLILAQKCRSNMIEAYLGKREKLDVADEYALTMLDNVLFGKLNIVAHIEKILEKEVIKPIDYYNILVRANQSITFCFYAKMMGEPIPEAVCVGE